MIVLRFRFHLLLLVPAFFLAAVACYSQPASVSKSFLTGRINYRKDTSFIRIPAKYTEREVYLKKQTFTAFLKMWEAALKDGVRLTILSGTRSYDDQKYKWDLKWNDAAFTAIADPSQKVLKLLRWWSMPGTSRHHWGTDMDLNNMRQAFYKSPAGIKMYSWMAKNAGKFGFVQPFSPGRTSGYQEEKWHWSFVPLSKVYLNEYVKQVKYDDIFGFQGSGAAKGLKTIDKWVLGINPACK